MRILHFSDPHLPPRLWSVPLSDWLSKRVTGAANLVLLRRRHFSLVRHKIAKLAHFAREQAVDYVLCTGDYTLLGTDHEMAAARRAIQPLVEASRDFVTVPGNHDLYTHRVVREQRFTRHFGDLLRNEAPENIADGTWPVVRWLGEEALVIAVSSSEPHRAPWRSSGHIPEGELKALDVLLDDARVRDRFVFVMTHHAPRLANGSSDHISRCLRNADDFLSVCSKIARGAILFGHVHRCYRLKLPGLNATLFNAGSATMALNEGLWIFDVAKDSVRATRGRWTDEGYTLDSNEAFDC